MVDEAKWPKHIGMDTPYKTGGNDGFDFHYEVVLYDERDRMESVDSKFDIVVSA